jgi:hypothetical protein
MNPAMETRVIIIIYVKRFFSFILVVEASDMVALGGGGFVEGFR